MPSEQRIIEVPRVYVTPEDAGTIEERFGDASTLLMEGKNQQAAAAFEQIVQLDPSGPFAPAALYNAGYAHEQAGAWAAALRCFALQQERFPGAEETRVALVRASRIQARMEQWSELEQTANRLLARSDLTWLDRVEALGAHALGSIEQGRSDDAMRSIAKARTVMEEQGYLDVGKLPVGVAQVYFALGEVRRLESERIVFVPVPTAFSQELERRCQLLLDAQDAYAQAMRSYDSHWAAMSGYRVGQLYQRLHRDLMLIPPPAAARTKQQRELFEGAMRLRYRVLLEKGLQMMDRTVAMAERTGEQSAWVNRAREAQRDLELALEQARGALQRLPYSEQDLRRALEGLASKSPP